MTLSSVPILGLEGTARVWPEMAFLAPGTIIRDISCPWRAALPREAARQVWRQPRAWHPAQPWQGVLPAELRARNRDGLRAPFPGLGPWPAGRGGLGTQHCRCHEHDALQHRTYSLPASRCWILPGCGEGQLCPPSPGLLSQQESPLLGAQGQKGEAALFPEGTPKERKGEVPLWKRGGRTEIILELCQSFSQ